MNNSIDLVLVKRFGTRFNGLDNARSALVADCIAKGIQPSYFVSPNKSGSNASCSPEQYRQLKEALAKALPATEQKLLALDPEKVTKAVKAARTALKKKVNNASIKALDKAQKVQADRNKVSGKISTMLRDMQRSLIVGYVAKAEVEAKAAGKSGKAVRGAVEAVKSKLTADATPSVSRKASKPRQPKTRTEISNPALALADKARDMLNSLQEFELDLPVTSREFNTAIKILQKLTALSEPKH